MPRRTTVSGAVSCSHTRTMSFAFGVAAALLLLFIPGWLIGRALGLPTHSAAVTAPALTYGLVGLCIVAFGSIGIPWNSLSAGFALSVRSSSRACCGAGCGQKGRPNKPRHKIAPRSSPSHSASRSGWRSSSTRSCAGSPTGNRSPAPGTRCGTATPSATSSIPGKHRRPEWVTSATSRRTPPSTTRRPSTDWPRCSAN